MSIMSDAWETIGGQVQQAFFDLDSMGPVGNSLTDPNYQNVGATWAPHHGIPSLTPGQPVYNHTNAYNLDHQMNLTAGV